MLKCQILRYTLTLRNDCETGLIRSLLIDNMRHAEQKDVQCMYVESEGLKWLTHSDSLSTYRSVR